MNTALENKMGDQLKQRREALRKKTPSKLDEFAPQLLQMAGEMKTIPDMLEWLKEREVTTSASNLSHFLKRQRQEMERNELKERLDGKKNLCETVQEWCENNRNPKLETVIGVFKMLVLNLATTKELDPQLLKLADRLARTAIGFANDRSRADYRTRKLVMEEAKHAEWVKCEQVKALQFCLAESKKYPAVADMYRAAAAALEAAMDGEGKAPSANPAQSGTPEKHQAPRAEERPIEDEEEEEEEGGRRVEGEQTETRVNKRACGRSRKGKAPRNGGSTKIQAPSSREDSNTKLQGGGVTASEIEEEEEDDEEEEPSEVVGLSEIDPMENATWRAQQGY